MSIVFQMLTVIKRFRRRNRVYALITSPLKRLLLRLALGHRTYSYMMRSIHWDPRIRYAKSVDLVVRKDAVERRIEADWIRTIARITKPFPLKKTTQTVEGTVPQQEQLQRLRSF